MILPEFFINMPNPLSAGDAGVTVATRGWAAYLGVCFEERGDDRAERRYLIRKEGRVMPEAAHNPRVATGREDAPESGQRTSTRTRAPQGGRPRQIAHLPGTEGSPGATRAPERGILRRGSAGMGPAQKQAPKSVFRLRGPWGTSYPEVGACG